MPCVRFIQETLGKAGPLDVLLAEAGNAVARVTGGYIPEQEDGWHMYEGGAFGSDGCLYMAPKKSARAARFDPTTETWETFGDTFPKGSHKWIGAAVSSFDNCIYSMPAECTLETHVLQIDPSKGSVRKVGVRVLEHAGGVKRDIWHGTVAAADGCVYGIPSHATSVLRFDPRTQELSTFGDLRGDGVDSVRYRSGILGPSGRFIFCVPAKAARVLCIDTKTQTCELIGDDFDSSKSGKWVGGGLGGDGLIYCIPHLSDRVLRIDPLSKTTSLFGPVLSTSSPGWFGGAAAANGCVYGTPYQSNRVLKIDPVAGTVSTVGTAISKQLQMKFRDAVLGPGGDIWCLIFNLPSRVLKLTIPSISPSVQSLRVLINNPSALQRCLSLAELRTVFASLLLRNASFKEQSSSGTVSNHVSLEQMQQDRPGVFSALQTTRGFPVALNREYGADFVSHFAASSAIRLAPAPNTWKPLPQTIDNWSWPPPPLVPLRAACKIARDAGPEAVQVAWPALSQVIAGLLVAIVDALREDLPRATKLLKDVFDQQRMRSLETYRKQLQRARRDPTYPEFKAVAGRLLDTCTKYNRKNHRVQTIKSFPRLYAAAYNLRPRFNNFLAELSRRCARSTALEAPVKGIGRALEKLALCPGIPDKIKAEGATVLDASPLVDVLRGSLKCPDFTEITFVLELLLQLDVEMGDPAKAKAAGIDLDKFQIYIINVKNRFTTPTSGGWADCMVNFRFAHGDETLHVMELQLQHEQMLVVRKEGKAHKQYNSFRSAFELLETVGHAPDDQFEETLEDQSLWEQVQMQMQQLKKDIHNTSQLSKQYNSHEGANKSSDALQLLTTRIDKCEAENRLLQEQNESLLSRVEKCETDNQVLSSKLDKLLSEIDKTKK